MPSDPTKRKRVIEPRIDPKTKKMDVGGLLIPPTSLITALLYGFAHHPRPIAREYYFWRICDELWNHDDLPEPMMVRHPWAEQMIRAAIHNKYLSIGGSASSGKSHTMAAWGIVNWLSQPRDTLILMTSTTLREARKRIWGSVISLLSVIDGAPIKIRDSIGNAAYVDEKENLIERAGLSLIAAEKSKTREAVGKFIGIKQKRVILVGDELSELSQAILQAGLTNLSKNPHFQMIGMANPNSRFDAFGVWSEPKDGWESVDIQVADEWDTKWGGKYIRLDGERSPNILLGETKYPWLPTAAKLEEDRILLGPESRGYMRMVRAIFFDSDETTGIYAESELTNCGAMGKVEWEGKPTMVAGIDPAFTNGGDRTILSIAEVGYARNGQYVCQFTDAIHLNDDATNKAVPRTYQIVQQIVDHCKRKGVSPENVAVDSTGAGAPFCDVLAGEWSPNFMRVTFGGKASDKRVSMNSQLTGEELYMNRVSELWFVGKELMRTRQIYGISSDLAQEMCARNYDMIKTGSLKVKIESKPDFKSRFGRSPDLADAAFLALDCARQRLGLVAVDPPKDDQGTGFRKRVTIESLGKALQNTDTSLLS
tara:strand:- start:1038 stop:2825 length:1788 start_codon:yes stop_codon:yes gene_type:complete